MKMSFLKKMSIIIGQIGILIAISLLGEFIVRMLHIPLPGSLMGMFILLGLLLSNILKVEWIELGAAVLIGDLLLFFIPSAIGIVQYKNLFGETGALLVGVVFVSILFVIATVVASTKWFTILQRRGYKLR